MKAAGRVLVLTAPYGSGHDRVAAALAQAFAAEGANARIEDHFERFVSSGFAWASRALFRGILRHAPPLWGCAYRLAAWLPTQSPAMLGMNRLGAKTLGRYLQTSRPDLVVHVHPTSAGAMSWLRSRGERVPPDAIVFTDFLAHRQWIYPHVDRYFVPAEEIGDQLVARNVPVDRVVVSGIPIDAGFTAPPDRAALRAELGLAGELPVALLVGGMHGWLGKIADVCTVLTELAVPLHVVVVCGVHTKLAATLRARFAGDERFRILGRVTEMQRLMGAADVVVTKAGGVTCAEALALERPLVFYRSLPGQERANERFLEQAGVGVRAPDRSALKVQLTTLFREPGRLVPLRASAQRLRRPEAARTVAKELLALAGAR